MIAPIASISTHRAGGGAGVHMESMVPADRDELVARGRLTGSSPLDDVLKALGQEMTADLVAEIRAYFATFEITIDQSVEVDDHLAQTADLAGHPEPAHALCVQPLRPRVELELDPAPH